LKALGQHGVPVQITYRAGAKQTSTINGATASDKHILVELDTPSPRSADTGRLAGARDTDPPAATWTPGYVTAMIADSDSYWRESVEAPVRLPSLGVCGAFGIVICRTFRIANVIVIAYRPRLPAVAAAVHELRLVAGRS